MKRPVGIAFMVAVLFVAIAAHATDVSVQTRHHGDEIIVVASTEFAARMDEAWAVLTDYDHLARFIPNMRSSRVIARSPAGPVVKQKGVARMFAFSVPFQVTLAVRELPPDRIESRGAGGSFREFRGMYELDADHGRTRLRYTCTMIPDFFVPPLLGTMILEHDVKDSLGALADEIVRRSEVSMAGREAVPARAANAH
jgi:hypothetical protein